MLSDLTFEMCVPSLRCSAAQRMHRKMPNCDRQYCTRHTRVRVAAGQHTLQLAHPAGGQLESRLAARALSLPGFFAPQSAQVPLPGTVLISSCSVRSLRACWRLFSAEAILCCRAVSCVVTQGFDRSATLVGVERASAAGTGGGSRTGRTRSCTQLSTGFY